jgi:hypothetical protein
LVADAIQLLAILLGISGEILQEIYNTWIIVAVLLGTFYVIRWFGLKPTKDSDYYKFQKYLRNLIRRKNRS